MEINAELIFTFVVVIELIFTFGLGTGELKKVARYWWKALL